MKIKNVILAFILYVVITVVLYLVASFYNISFDFALRTSRCRLAVSLFNVFALVCVSVVFVGFQIEDEKVKQGCDGKKI